MSDLKFLHIEEEDGVVLVRIERPEARNAFTFELLDSLTEIAGRLRRRADVKAVILAGQADYFSVGQDLKAPPRPPMTLIERRIAHAAGPDMCRAWEEIEAVTVAAIEGHCIGGACALTLACDFRIMGEGASLRLPEVPLGMSMPWRTLPRLTSLAGPARAKRFAIFGEAADAATCLEWGLADEVAAKGGALERARAWASKVAGLPPLPVRMTKEAINAAAQANHYVSSFMDRDQYLLTSTTADVREGVAAFREKRSPSFKGD